MQPHLFRQRLLELAAEYESLYAGARPDGAPPNRRSCYLPPEALGAPAEPADVGASGATTRVPSALAGDGEGAQRTVNWSPSSLVLDRAKSPKSQISYRSSGSTPSDESVTPSEVSGTPRHSIASGKGKMQRCSLQDADAARVVKSIRETTLSKVVDDTTIAWFVKSNYFTVALASLIIFSALLIGIETQILSGLSYQESGSEQVLTVLSTMNYVVTSLFAVEMVARLYVFRCDFFVNERMWNMFDLIILVLALAEVALEIVVRSSSGTENSVFDNGGTAKMMRLIRLTRLLRLVRTFRQLKPMRMLIRSIMAAGKSVFWALLLLVMIVYAFGVVLTQAVTEHTEGGDRIEDDNLISYYGDLFRSMLSLMMAVSGGISWIELTTPLEGMGSSMWIMLFLIYIAIVYFFILNVVTGVFCQNAIEGAQQDLDTTLDAHIKEKQMHAERLGSLFKEMNQNGDALAELTIDDLNKQLAKPKVESWFRSLDIDYKQTWELFKVIDADNSGRIDLYEFVEGCLRLRGPATRVDVASLKWEIRRANRGALPDSEKKRLSRPLGSAIGLFEGGDSTVASAFDPACKTSL